MLAERLLAKSDFENDSELRTLEHLKLRFGENNLHDCEVIIQISALLNSGLPDGAMSRIAYNIFLPWLPWASQIVSPLSC